ncbi:MAG: type II secretion system protein [Planctomycetota bacterium]
MDRKSARNGGFTLVEMMIVIGVIVTLMGLVVVVAPLINEMLKKTQTENNLQLLTQALTNYKEVFLPEDTKYEGNVADNAHLIKELEIEEKMLKDGWGNDIYYDNLKDEDGEPDINRSLPQNPIAEEFPTLELSPEEIEKLRWDFVVWSLGSSTDAEDTNDNLSKCGNKMR